MEVNMPTLVRSSRDKAVETEKLTLNLGYVDLGRIDLLVQQGFYSNRSDFIRSAVRKELDAHAEAISKTAARHTLELGLLDYTKSDLEQIQASGAQVHIKVIGLARIANDVPAELARRTIASVSVLGALQASAAVKAALADRTR
jgi:Arc/MetJ-type ribon-helix-helix transcriptional regulator